MNRTHFLRWLDRMYTTLETEIDCERLQALLPSYVDFEATGGDPGSYVAPVRAHLAQCPDCAHEYEALRAVVQLEARGRLPQVEDSLAQFEAEPAPEAAETVPA